MMRTLAKSLIGASCLALLAVGTASAGGLERGGYNIDLLFDQSRFASEVSATYVHPDRQIYNARDTNPLDGSGADGVGGGTTTARFAEDYWVPRIGLKAGLGAVDCMTDYSQPWGIHSAPGREWVGAQNDIETKVNSDNYAGTCSLKMDASRGQFRVIGGVFYQELDGFKERLVAPLPEASGLSGVGRLNLETNGVGWRIGGAYEIEEIALRASVVYNSAVDLDEITGTLDLTQLPVGAGGNPLAGRVTDVFGNATMPQSVELKLQSGIAPDWLAFGSLKWVDWSVLQSVAFCPTALKAVGLTSCTYNGTLGGSAVRVTSLDLLYQDGWTVSGGIGHKFNDTVSGAMSVTWDRGTTTGLQVQTDTWTLSGGGSYTPNQNVELRVGGAVGVLTSGSAGVVTDSAGNQFGTDVAYDFGNDFVGALQGSVKIKF